MVDQGNDAPIQPVDVTAEQQEKEQDFTPVKIPYSSNVSEVSYNKSTQVLIVRFVSGRVYSYEGIDEQTARGFETSISAGRYLNSFIKPLYAEKRLA